MPEWAPHMGAPNKEATMVFYQPVTSNVTWLWLVTLLISGTALVIAGARIRTIQLLLLLVSAVAVVVLTLWLERSRGGDDAGGHHRRAPGGSTSTGPPPTAA